MNTTDLITHGLAFIIGALSLYFTAYTKAKGANKALKEDIEVLENAKQEIITKHAAELESIKKDHVLDIEKRKYQYEAKRAQFSKFFQLIDEFNSKCNSVFVERFPPMFQRLLAGQLSECAEVSNNSVLEFNAEIMQLFNELNEEQLKVTHESNSIRLIATPEIDTLLDQLALDIKSSYDDSVSMLKFMGTPEYFIDNSTIAPYQTRLTESGYKVISSREALKAQMKMELNEI
ncbi:hypothetical protein P7F88_00905 [Vibrio hannami]|uniref:hypothetical protein n=1 Tax=Vibrio hannami TaxID=2717094 RepID=UPI00240FDB5C|nr:hypothetical protein [Vibrio hannami]MDG3084724.1 hypothetical protein [Vibrio hannami]